MATFKPTKTAVEVRLEKQARLGSLYRDYLEARYELGVESSPMHKLVSGYKVLQ